MGKKIRVTPEELDKVSKQLGQISKDYTDIYVQLLQKTGTMGEAWEGTDNIAFVDQINGFCEELKLMAKKINVAAEAMEKQKINYANRQETNITQVKKLAN